MRHKYKTNRNHPIGSFVEFKKEDIDQTIVTRFEQQVLANPNRLAVKSMRSELTYTALNQAANRLARTIIVRRGSKKEPIALLLEHDTSIIVAIMGILKAGGIYVPLEPTYPAERLAYMLADSQACLIITNTRNFDAAKCLSGEVLNLDEIPSNIPYGNPALPISPDNLAYILYTSGSTGQPKGVFNNHRNLLHQVMNYTNSVRLGPEDRHSLLQSCSFSRTLKEVFGTLLNGATLCIYDIKENGLVHLADWLEKEAITILGSAVTVYRLFVGTIAGNKCFPSLRLIYLGAEPLYKKDMELYKTNFSPECILIHGMGTTETGTFLRFTVNKETQTKGNSIPVGYALPDMEVRLIDETGNDAELHKEGEIAVTSSYLTLGYWGKPEMTRAAFQVEPQSGSKHTYFTGDMGRLLDDGSIVHLGRKDFQLKIHGHRVEIAEIEGALYNVEGVEQAAIATRNGKSGDRRLVAFLVAKRGESPRIDDLRRVLMDKLPEYMIPDDFIFLNAIPVTPNGKVDHRALPVPDPLSLTRSEAYVAPEGWVEEMLADVWQTVLGVERISTHDNFFELGGHSIQATQIVARLSKTYGITLALRQVFEYPTLAELAMVIEEMILSELDEAETL